MRVYKILIQDKPPSELNYTLHNKLIFIPHTIVSLLNLHDHNAYHKNITIRNYWHYRFYLISLNLMRAIIFSHFLS